MSSLRYKSLADARQAGIRLEPVTPATAKPRPLAPVLKLIQDLAAAHGWAGEDHLTYNPDGPDRGLHIILVREVILFAEVQAVKGERSLSQRHWLETLRATGQCEVYEWGPEDIPVIKERLTRTRQRKDAAHG